MQKHSIFKRLRIWRAWPVFVYSTLGYFITSTVASSMNVAAGVFASERGWDAVLITSMISIASLGNVLCGFIAGRLCVRHSAKMMALIWGAIYLLGILLMGVSTDFSLFVIAMVLANAASSAWGYNTNPVLITNWFPKYKGTVQGIVSMGIPLGAGFASVCFMFGYGRWGIEGANLPFAIIAGVTLLLLVFGITSYPEQMGLEPDTMMPCERRNPGLAGARPEGCPPDLPKMGHVKVGTGFVVLSLILGTQLLFAGGLMVQIAPRLFELGYSMDEALAGMIVTAGFACAGSIVCGAIGDRYGASVGVILTFVLGIVGILLNVTGQHTLVMASLALIGVVTGSADNWPVNICAEQFGREGFASSFSIMQPIIQLVGAAGPALFAQAAGLTGSYEISYLIGAALLLIGLVLYCLFIRKGTKLGGGVQGS